MVPQYYFSSQPTNWELKSHASNLEMKQLRANTRNNRGRDATEYSAGRWQFLHDNEAYHILIQMKCIEKAHVHCILNICIYNNNNNACMHFSMYL